MKTAQIEFIVIVALLILVTVVIFYAYQSGVFSPSSVPAGVGNKIQAVKISVQNLIREASFETLKTIGMYGGYLKDESFPLGSVRFLGKSVPYWQRNGKVIYPDVKQKFVQGVTNYINLHKDTLAKAIDETGGVSLGEPKVVVNFLQNKIVLTVNLPTVVDGYSIKEPYVVEIPSKFSKVEEFAKSFINYEVSNRPFEYYTISSMMLSPVNNGIPDVPFFLFLTRCGESVYKDWWDIKPGVEHAIKLTLAHTYMPGKVPTNTIHTSSYPKYTLVPINGKRYSDLQVSFHLPDKFELTRDNFEFIPDPVSLESEIIPLVGMCQSEPINIKYSLTYPAIIRIKDPLTGYVFQYAFQVYIKDNAPGNWKAEKEHAEERICENPGCKINLHVKATDGSPIKEASVEFMGCMLGKTDSQGNFNGLAPCGISSLRIYKKGYDNYDRMIGSDSLNDLTVTLIKKPTVNLYFYQVFIQNLSSSQSYKISPDSIRPIEDSQYITMVWYNMDKKTKYQLGSNTQVTTLFSIPAGSYMVGMNLMEGIKNLGGFVTEYNLEEDIDGGTLYIFLPRVEGFEEIEDPSQRAEALTTLTNILIHCGIHPISKFLPESKMCVVRYNEI